MLNEWGMSSEQYENIRKAYALRAMEGFMLYTCNGYQSKWFHHLICKTIDRWISGDILRLILVAPPRHGKSYIVSERLPAYILGKFPGSKVLSCSCTQDLADSMSRKSRGCINSVAYQELFKDTKIKDGSGGIREWETTSGGLYKCAGVGTGIVGRGFTHGLIDDPIASREIAESEVYRDRIKEWYYDDFLTRAESDSAPILLMHTRWNEDDLAGYLIDKEKGNWYVLTLPAELDEDCIPTDGDNRKTGEPLWPERFPKLFLEEKKKRPYSWNSLYQGRPSSPEGDIININKIQRYKVLPNKDLWREIVVSADTAQKENELKNDPSVFGVWVRTENSFYLINFYRGWWSQPKLEQMIIDINSKHKPHRFIIENKSSGQGLIQFVNEKTTISVHPMEPDSGKVIRMSNESGAVEAGRIFVPEEAPWVIDLLDRWKKFPNGRYKDDADMLSQVLKYFRENTSDIQEDDLEVGGERVTARQVW